MFLSFGKGQFSSALYFISKIFNISKENQLDFGDLKYNTLSHFITCKKNIWKMYGIPNELYNYKKINMIQKCLSLGLFGGKKGHVGI